MVPYLKSCPKTIVAAFKKQGKKCAVEDTFTGALVLAQGAGLAVSRFQKQIILQQGDSKSPRLVDFIATQRIKFYALF